MTQIEKLIARLKTLDPGLHEIVLYVKPNGEIGFWIVAKNEHKLEGEKIEKK